MNLDIIKKVFKIWQGEQVVTDLRNTVQGVPPVKSLYINTDALEYNSSKCSSIRFSSITRKEHLLDQRVIEEMHYLLVSSEDKRFYRNIWAILRTDSNAIREGVSNFLTVANIHPLNVTLSQEDNTLFKNFQNLIFSDRIYHQIDCNLTVKSKLRPEVARSFLQEIVNNFDNTNIEIMYNIRCGKTCGILSRVNSYEVTIKDFILESLLSVDLVEKLQKLKTPPAQQRYKRGKIY